MHEGLLELEKRGTDIDRHAVAALRKIEQTLAAAGIRPRLRFLKNAATNISLTT